MRLLVFILEVVSSTRSLVLALALRMLIVLFNTLTWSLHLLHLLLLHLLLLLDAQAIS